MWLPATFLSARTGAAEHVITRKLSPFFYFIAPIDIQPSATVLHNLA